MVGVLIPVAPISSFVTVPEIISLKENCPDKENDVPDEGLMVRVKEPPKLLTLPSDMTMVWVVPGMEVSFTAAPVVLIATVQFEADRLTSLGRPIAMMLPEASRA